MSAGGVRWAPCRARTVPVRRTSSPEWCSPRHGLQVTAKDLVAALKLVKKFAGNEKKVGEALLGFDGTYLAFELAGVIQKTPAVGDWTGEARVSGAFVMRFANIDATPDLVEMTVNGTQLTVRSGSWTYDILCKWEKAPRPCEGLPMKASFRDTVTFGFAHAPEHIERLGLTPVVEAAMTKAEKHMAAAAEPLRELGITVDDIRELVKRKFGGGR